MQIYSNDEYYEKQRRFIKESVPKNSSESFKKKKAPVIKDYIYYAEPVKIV